MALDALLPNFRRHSWLHANAVVVRAAEDGEQNIYGYNCAACYTFNVEAEHIMRLCLIGGY